MGQVYNLARLSSMELAPDRGFPSPRHPWRYRDGKKICSINSRFIVNMCFTNRTSHVVELFWINFSGEEVSYGLIEPGSTYLLYTYLSHPWVFRNKAKRDQVMTVNGKTVTWPSQYHTWADIEEPRLLEWTPATHVSDFRWRAPEFGQDVRNLLMAYHAQHKPATGRLRCCGSGRGPSAGGDGSAHGVGIGGCVGRLWNWRGPHESAAAAASATSHLTWSRRLSVTAAAAAAALCYGLPATSSPPRMRSEPRLHPSHSSAASGAAGGPSSPHRQPHPIHQARANQTPLPALHHQSQSAQPQPPSEQQPPPQQQQQQLTQGPLQTTQGPRTASQSLGAHGHDHVLDPDHGRLGTLPAELILEIIRHMAPQLPELQPMDMDDVELLPRGMHPERGPVAQLAARMLGPVAPEPPTVDPAVWFAAAGVPAEEPAGADAAGGGEGGVGPLGLGAMAAPLFPAHILADGEAPVAQGLGFDNPNPNPDPNQQQHGQVAPPQVDPAKVAEMRQYLDAMALANAAFTRVGEMMARQEAEVPLLTARILAQAQAAAAQR